MRPTKAVLILSLIVGLGMAVSACEKAEGPAPEPKGTVTALMLIDMQYDFLQANGRRPVAQNQVEPMIKATNAMIEAMRKQALPIIYIEDEFSPFQFVYGLGHNWATQRYESGSGLDPRVYNWAGVYFRKEDNNAFTNGELDSHLKIIDCGRIVIAGVYADASVRATAKSALRRGYSVTVISDAVAGSSDQARDAALNDLKQAGAQIETSGQFISSLGAGAEEKKA